MKPLDATRILDLTRLLPGAVCSMLLRDLGAEIIKIEDPLGGDYARWMPPLIDGSGHLLPQQQPRQEEHNIRLEI